jgi:ABC-type lipoprotein export system ATPase subunit
MDDPLVRLDCVTRTFHRGGRAVAAVRDASIVVRRGARLAFVGVSGSGKTTLLHLLGGLDTPTTGDATWPALGPRETLRPGNVAYAFQVPSLLSALTVEENVALPLLLGGASERDASDAARDVLRALGLDDLTNRLPEELSGGQNQRVGVARAIAARPMVLLADEPTGQLDHATASSFVEAALALLRPGAAFVTATHDDALAALMDERVAMRDGRLEEAS